MNNRNLIRLHVAMARSGNWQAMIYDVIGYDDLAMACRKSKAECMAIARQLKADACR